MIMLWHSNQDILLWFESRILFGSKKDKINFANWILIYWFEEVISSPMICNEDNC